MKLQYIQVISLPSLVNWVLISGVYSFSMAVWISGFMARLGRDQWSLWSSLELFAAHIYISNHVKQGSFLEHFSFDFEKAFHSSFQGIIYPQLSLKDHLEIDLYKDFPPCLRLLFANVVQVVVLSAEVIILVTWVILVQGHVSLVLGDREGLSMIINQFQIMISRHLSYSLLFLSALLTLSALPTLLTLLTL